MNEVATAALDSPVTDESLIGSNGNGQAPPVAEYRALYRQLADCCRNNLHPPTSLPASAVDEIWRTYDAKLAALDGADAAPVIITALDGLSESVRDIISNGKAEADDRLFWLDLYPRNVLMLLGPRSNSVTFADSDDDEDDDQPAERELNYDD